MPVRVAFAKLGLLVAPAALVACGAAADLDDDAVASSAPSSESAPPTAPFIVAFAGGDASPTPPACTFCTADDECGAGGACVAGVDGTGFCAPGCSKEGFGTPDRACSWVTDPVGHAWAACLARAGECAALRVLAAEVRSLHVAR
jgi:hypothetical protein